MGDKVNGVEVSGYHSKALRTSLEDYCKKSKLALQHVKAAGAMKPDPVSIDVTQTGGLCHANKGVVEISHDACSDENTGAFSASYLGESVLFELENARNRQQYTDLKSDVSKGTISVLQYGLGYCKVEFEATKRVASILSQILLTYPKHPVSTWGKKQILASKTDWMSAAGKAHDPKSKAPEKHLLSKYFYVHEYLQKDSYDKPKKVSGMNTVVRGAAIIKKGAKFLDKRAWGEFDWGGKGKLDNKTPAWFFPNLIHGLCSLNSEKNFSVTWKGGLECDWKGCADAFILEIPKILKDGPTTNSIKNDIMGAHYKKTP